MQRVNDKKADQVTVRRLNMSAILKLLRDRGTLARADLDKELGMTRNTASNIVTDLLQASPTWRPWLEKAKKKHRETWGETAKPLADHVLSVTMTPSASATDTRPKMAAAH